MVKAPGRKSLIIANQHVVLKIGLLVITSGLALASLIIPIALRPSSYNLKAGDVASQDILAPSDLTFQSDLLTQVAKESAAAAVAPIYLSADTNITRHQIERFNVALNYIATVRQDSYASSQQKISDFQAMSDVQLSNDTIQKILYLNDYRWKTIQDEATNVLEQIMRGTIREDQLDSTRKTVPSLISYSISEDQAEIVINLVTPFVVANSLYSADQTQTARQAAEDSIKPVDLSYVTGQTIVLRGQIITNQNMETLEKYGLIHPSNGNLDLIADSALVALIAILIFIYFYRRRNSVFEDDIRGLALLAGTFLVFLFAARYLIPNRTIIPYLFPLSAFGLTIAAIYNLEMGVVFSLVLSILATHGLTNGLELTVFYIFTSLCGVLVLGKARRIASFFWSGVAIGGAGIAIILVYRLPDQLTDWVGLATLAGAALFNGIASASLTLLFQYLFSQILGLTTAFQLLEISRPDNPLLQYILRNAPGTYQHSLQVANLAEQAAERIGADPLLVRAGALYHDAGKATNPGFFIENQVPGKLNPHDDLDPVTSAAIIIQHVTDGIQLAKKYRLPLRIQNFISEHHGTLLTRYQYTRAVEAANNQQDKVDQELFRYPGPRPQSKETALLMLADGVEARARSELPKDEVALRKLVKVVFDYLEREGQLDNTDLTLQDLSMTLESFCSTLRNTYHPRIQYPELKTTPSQPEMPENKSGSSFPFPQQRS